MSTTGASFLSPVAGSEPVAQSGHPLVELRGVTKAFPGVVANDSVDLVLNAGEVHCLLGENGAGKSTLMQILSGMYRPDSGEVRVDGEPAVIDSTRAALDLGIGMVYQHNTLIPGFSVLENLMLGPAGALRLDRKKAAVRFREMATKLGVDIDPRAITGDLALGRQQQVEIIKVLVSGSRVLILDEPTAMLTPREALELEKVLGSLKGGGLAVVFITHKLREAFAVADRMTVLRRGRVAGRLGPEDLRGRDIEVVRRQILSIMFGNEADVVAAAPEMTGTAAVRRTRRSLPGEAALIVEAMSIKPGRQEVGIRDISFAVRPGEIFGIAGVDGNGQQELAEAIAGQKPVAHGRLIFAGRDITRASVARRQQMGLRFVTDDRLGEATVPSMPVSVNLLLKRIGHRPFWGRTGKMSYAQVCEAAGRLVEEFDIRTPGVDTECGNLSGGNVQKVILARELSFDPKLVVYNKPTYGLDAMTTVAIRERVRRLSEESGVSAVLISTDLEELVDLSDRIGVMFRGRLVGIVENDGDDVEERVGALMLGEAGGRR
jgi:general nucleoside transport system ATP-binding protein